MITGLSKEAVPLDDASALQSQSDERSRIREVVIQRLAQAYQRNARYFNLRRRGVEFQVGQTVYRRNFVQSSAVKHFTAKLAPKFIGPFKVKRKVGYRAYLLEDENGKSDGPWHIGDLKPCPQPDESTRKKKCVSGRLRCC